MSAGHPRGHPSSLDLLDLDLLDGAFYVSDPYPTYARLRDEYPLHRDEANDLWAVSRYDDIVAIEKDKATFVNSGQPADGPRLSPKTGRGYRPNIPADRSIIGLDDPHHLLRRNVVAQRAPKPRRQLLSRWKILYPQHRPPAQQMTSSLPKNVRRVPAPRG